MSPKAQRPTRGGKPLMGRGGPISDASPHPPAAGTSRPYHPRSPKPGAVAPTHAAQDLPASAPSPTSPPETRGQPPPASGSLDPAGSSSPKPATPAPTFTDVKEMAPSTGKDLARPAEISPPGSLELSKAAGKGLLQSPSDHKRNQIEELKKFGEDFRLQSPAQEPGSGSSRFKEGADKAKEPPEEKPPIVAAAAAVANPTGAAEAQAEAAPPTQPEPSERREDKRQLPEAVEGPLPASSPLGKCESGEEEKEGVSEQVKKSTLNPNAKEFNPTKQLAPVGKPASTPTPPRPQTQPSPSIMVTPGQNTIYNTQYISYVHGIHHGIHMNPAVQ
ncbi:ataxin-2-like protein, partial [Cetorhinus maximus]